MRDDVRQEFQGGCVVEGVLILLVVEEESSDGHRLATGVERGENLAEAELRAEENGESENFSDVRPD